LTAHAEHDQTDATAIKVVRDTQQVRGTPGKAIWLAGHERVTSADEPQGLAETIALRHSGHLLREDFLAAGSLEVPDLCVQSSPVARKSMFSRSPLECRAWPPSTYRMIQGQSGRTPIKTQSELI
jgi:hypothetical protein